MIEFLFNRKVRKIETLDPNMSVLDWLRTETEQRGTKEGCGTGDCGACTIAVGEMYQNRIRYRTFNACCFLMGNLHHKQLISVDALTTDKELESKQLHPVQHALAECHASQCGFCTPGFVMSLYTLYLNHVTYPGEAVVIRALSGNLCRCTGYRAILSASKKMFEYPRAENNFEKSFREFSDQWDNLTVSLTAGNRQFFLPPTLEDFFKLRQTYPDAQLIAGGTDLALDITQKLQQFSTLISVAQINELNILEISDNGCFIGAAVPYSDFIPPLCSQYPEAKEVLYRIGSEQIRNAGTLGGSLGNASPVGDPAPLLMALGAEVFVQGPTHERQIKLADFFIGYRQTVLRNDEIIIAIDIPPRQAEQRIACYKIAKRFEDDISSVFLAMSYEIKDNHLCNVTTGFGGMAATPSPAPNLEAALEGMLFSPENLRQAAEALLKDFKPMSDVRASSQYRLTVGKNLLQRLWFEQHTDVARIHHAAR